MTLWNESSLHTLNADPAMMVSAGTLMNFISKKKYPASDPWITVS